MAISKRTRAKGCLESHRLLPQARVLWYAPGRSGPQPTLTGWGIFGCFVLFSIVLMMVSGSFVFPGLLLFAAVHHALCPPRALVVCDRGVALVTRSFLTSKPNGLVGLCDIANVRPREVVARQVRIDVGPEHIWLTRAEEQQFRAALAGRATPAMAG